MISFVKSSGTGKIKGNGDRKEQWLSRMSWEKWLEKGTFWNSGTFYKCTISLVQFSRSVVSDSFATQWTTAHQASLSITNSWSLPKLMSIESVMPSNHVILCRPLLLLPSVFPRIRVFSNESALCNSSVQFSHSVVSDSLRLHESQHARPPCLSPTPGVHSDSRPLIRDSIQPSHPGSSPSPPAPNLSQHQSLLQWVNSSHEVTKVLELQL